MGTEKLDTAAKLGVYTLHTGWQRQYLSCLPTAADKNTNLYVVREFVFYSTTILVNNLKHLL